MECTEFIRAHKKKYINYCEILISSTGEIEYAVPSHIEKLIKVSGKSRDEINIIMPINASPMEWLSEYTNYCACWYNYCVLPFKYTNKQIYILKRLQNQKIISNCIMCKISVEMTHCNLLDKYNTTGDKKYLDKIISLKKNNMIISGGKVCVV